MSAATLREAAALMRERAEASRDWNADVEPGDSLHLWVIEHDPSDPTGQTPMQRMVGGADAPWSDHIASWQPAVALAVADWLAGVRLHHELDGDGRILRFCSQRREQDAALAVARAYLGRES